MEIDLGHPLAARRHIRVLLRRRDHLKKVATERLRQGKEATYDLTEISAINSVLNELLAIRSSRPESEEEEFEPQNKPDSYPIEVDNLSKEEAMAMIFPVKKYPISVQHAKRIRILPNLEIRISRTKSEKMEMVNIALWKLKEGDDEWRSTGGFRIPSEAFSVLVKELINLEL